MSLTHERLLEALEANAKYDTHVAAAESLGPETHAYQYRLKRAKQLLADEASLEFSEEVDGFSTPRLPDGEMPTDELIEHMTSRYNKRLEAKDARTPIPVKLASDERSAWCSSATRM